MLRGPLRKLLYFLPAVFLINFFGFAYAHYARWVQLTRNPMYAVEAGAEPVWPLYQDYLLGLMRGDMGPMPGAYSLYIEDILGSAVTASLGLLGIVFVLSTMIGIIIGLSAVRTNPPRVASVLIPISTISLAMPSFYIGATLITASVYYLLYMPGVQGELIFPLHGFGWDEHLVYPTIALMVRPAMQIAQTSATMMAGELRNQYVAVARSFGHSWRRIRWKTALRNVFAPIIVTVSGSLRLLVGELILVEWLFGWPGIGKLLASTLQPPNIAAMSGADLPDIFLNPPLVASILAVLAALFLFTDFLAALMSNIIDPRLRTPDREETASRV